MVYSLNCRRGTRLRGSLKMLRECSVLLTQRRGKASSPPLHFPQFETFGDVFSSLITPSTEVMPVGFDGLNDLYCARPCCDGLGVNGGSPAAGCAIAFRSTREVGTGVMGDSICSDTCAMFACIDVQCRYRKKLSTHAARRGS